MSRARRKKGASSNKETKVEKRKNNPPVGLVSTITDKLNSRTKYAHEPYIDLTLNWAGKTAGMSLEMQNAACTFMRLLHNL